jgi:exonuclease III
MSVRIATWNLCLGLLNKKDHVLNELNLKKIDVCCLQETDLDPSVLSDILDNRQYKFEPKKSTTKRRVGLYINRNIIYKRREDLEESNLHLIIVDINFVRL